MKVYLDNASTSFPKPREVANSIYNYLTNIGGNPGRSNHYHSMESNRIIFNTREKIASFFNFPTIENIIFTKNITESLNILLNGILKKGDHVITSSMEHNAVIRPLHLLKNLHNIELSIVNAPNTGIISSEDVKKEIKENTKLIIITHASNVTGSIQPIKEIGDICKKNNL